jgi:hypothetical protein
MNTTSDYTSRQRQHDAEYQREYDQWLDSLSEEELSELEKHGLDHASIEKVAHSVGREKDLGETAVQHSHRSIESDAPKDAKLLESIRLIVSTLISEVNLKVSICGLCFACGLSACSVWGSQANAAKAIGVSRQHLGKSTKFWQRTLDLPQNPYTSSKSKSAKLKKVQTENHWRRKKFDAPKKCLAKK